MIKEAESIRLVAIKDMEEIQVRAATVLAGLIEKVRLTQDLDDLILITAALGMYEFTLLGLEEFRDKCFRGEA